MSEKSRKTAPIGAVFAILFYHSHFVKPINNVRCKAVIAASRRGFIFPKRSGRDCHVKEISFDIIEKFFMLAETEKKLKTEIISDKRI